MRTPARDRGVPTDERVLARRLQTEGARLARANAEFAALSPAVQRVAIAQDVLAWLSIGRLRATISNYLSDGADDYSTESTRCDACALGAVFAVTATRSTRVARALDEAWSELDPDEMQDTLAPYFDLEQLRLIETAFEADVAYAGLPDDELCQASQEAWWARADAAAKFCEHLGPKGRMRAIMKNVIQHNGTFDPTAKAVRR